MKEGEAESEAAKTTEAAEEEEEEEDDGSMPTGCVLVIEGIQNREIGKGAIKAALEEDFDVSNFYFGYLHSFFFGTFRAIFLSSGAFFGVRVRF